MSSSAQVGLNRDLLDHTIGSSDCAIAADLNPFQKLPSLYGRLVGEIPPSDDNMFTLLGRLLEPHIIAWYSEEVGEEVQLVPSLVHPTETWARDTPDGISLVDGRPRRAIDAKLVFPNQSGNWGDGPEDIPDDKYCQMQWHCLFNELDECDVPAWIIPRRGIPQRRIYRIKYHEAAARELLGVNRDFWHRHVVPRVPPPVDGSASTLRYLAARFPRESEIILPSTDSAERWAQQSFAARQTIKSAKKIQDEADAHLIALIGACAGIEGLATYKLEGKGPIPVSYTREPKRVLRLKYEEE